MYVVTYRWSGREWTTICEARSEKGLRARFRRYHRNVRVTSVRRVTP